MIYIYIFVPLFFIGLLVWNTVRGNRRLKAIKKYAANADVSRIALWVDLDLVDDQKPNFKYSYWKNVDNPANNTNRDVAVLLLKAGNHKLAVGSKKGSELKNRIIDVCLKPGVTYKLGSNTEEFFLIEEVNSKQYDL